MPPNYNLDKYKYTNELTRASVSERLYINGPVNAIRLVGSINNIDKVVYLFSDNHLPPIEQNKCTSAFSKDIKEYIATNFANASKKSNKIYDFMIETGIHEHKPRPNKYLEDKFYGNQHIDKILHLSKQIFDIDYASGKMNPSKYFNNVRMHFTDIRYTLLNQFYMLQYILDTITNIDYVNINIKRIKDILKTLTKYVKVLDEYIDTDKKFAKKINALDYDMNDNKQMLLYFEYYTSKLTSSYTHQNVKAGIIQILKKFRDGTNDVIHLLKNLLKDIKIFKKNLGDNGLYMYNIADESVFLYKNITISTNDLSYETEKVYINYLDTFTLLMDAYFIRRMCDKDYITNIIMYAGAAHIANYIYILCHYFDFKVTHCANCEVDDIDELNKLIISYDVEHVRKIAYGSSMIRQCSDLTNFPSNFE